MKVAMKNKDRFAKRLAHLGMIGMAAMVLAGCSGGSSSGTEVADEVAVDPGVVSQAVNIPTLITPEVLAALNTGALITQAQAALVSSSILASMSGNYSARSNEFLKYGQLDALPAIFTGNVTIDATGNATMSGRILGVQNIQIGDFSASGKVSVGGQLEMTVSGYNGESTNPELKGAKLTGTITAGEGTIKDGKVSASATSSWSATKQ